MLEEYKDEVITCPTTPEELTPIEEVFRNRWNIPHAVGALDGKHVAIRKTCQEWLLVPQLQGILLCGPHGPCGCRI